MNNPFESSSFRTATCKKTDIISRVYDIEPNLTKLTVLNYIETNFKLQIDNFHPQKKSKLRFEAHA